MPTYSGGDVTETATMSYPVPAGRSSISARQRDFRVDLAKGKNTHANVAIVCAALSLLAWPFACVAGFVFGALGLRRAGQYVAVGHPPIGRGLSFGALALSAVGTVVTVVTFMFR